MSMIQGTLFDLPEDEGPDMDDEWWDDLPSSMYGVGKVRVDKEKLIEQMMRSLSADLLSVIVESIAELVYKKNKDYGDAWQTFGCFTALIRINDKLLRVKNLSDGTPALVAGESIVDNLRDVIGYASLALMWIEENANARKDK